MAEEGEGDDDRIGVPSDRIADIGSERLALALANHDVLGVGQALRHDYVVVPLARDGDGEAKLLVTAFRDTEGRQRFELPLFSSAQTLSLYAGGAQNTEFAVRQGTTLIAVLEQNSTVLDRVLFDPAGPHPMTATAEEVLASLQPRLGDDEVAWAASAGATVDLEQITIGSGAEHPTALDITLPADWTAIDLENPAPEQIVRRYFPRLFDRSNRVGLERFVTVAVAAAAKLHTRFLAVTVMPVDGEPLAVAMATNWHEIGPAIGDVSHLDRIAQRLPGTLATAPAGRYLRVTDDRPVVEYWLEFPDRRGLASIAFSMPDEPPTPALLEITDRIAASASWVS
jgi:hypothetical protein